ncbi:MAG: hypothetical protein HOQ26_11150 [Gemmatimonadaceae bacterium]|nr:hypothetical protein [Gemmatimonadaceae bacterium]NUQ93451.1 hypothetical protein [Gemmatimonadaceae bacterium]
MTAALDRLRGLGEPFMEELSRAQWLVGAGYTSDIDLRGIYAAHADALSDESLAAALEAFRDAAPGSEEHRSARALLDWQIEARAARATAQLEERELAWEATATVRLDDGRAIPYQRAHIEISNATDRAERLKMDAARGAVVARELAPLRRERFAREREVVDALDVAPSYIDAIETISALPLRALGEQCARFLRDTEAMSRELLSTILKRQLAIDPADAARSDALALARAPEFDAAFPAADLQPAVARQLGEMGLAPDANGRIVYDTAEREGKRARAFCAPVRIPEEVHLVLRPHGGASDWTTLLHEAGHALHFANVRPELPFEHRWLGDNSVTEGYAMLFDHRMQDKGWLRRYTGLAGAELSRFLRRAGFEELRFLRRYCAKLLYELDLHGGAVSESDVPALYAERLTAATGFRYSPDDAYADVDPRFYAGRYLQAWQLQSILAGTLTESFDEDWWRNPRSGPWLRDNLFAEGQRETAGELASRVAGRPLDFAPLITAIERLVEG